MHLSPFFTYDVIGIIQTFGYVGIFAIIFAESGLFFGFFLPGDSLLFPAGLLASQGVLSIAPLVLLVVVAAIAGDSVGYWFGAKVGPKLFDRRDSFFFNKKHIARARLFYEQYGAQAVILSRFIPIVRTFTPILAGVGSMRYALFLRYNILGGLFWGGGVTLAAYALGNAIPNLEHYLTPIILVIIATSFLPVVSEMIRNRRR